MYGYLIRGNGLWVSVTYEDARNGFDIEADFVASSVTDAECRAFDCILATMAAVVDDCDLYDY